MDSINSCATALYKEYHDMLLRNHMVCPECGESPDPEKLAHYLRLCDALGIIPAGKDEDKEHTR